MVEYSTKNTFHVSKPMASMVKKRKNNRDPFKTPDPLLVVQEEAEQRLGEFDEKRAQLMAEKEDVILNLTIQKQKLKDIISEMEK